MTLFTIGFVFIMIFTVLVGIGAIVFISFDANPNPAKIPQDDPYNSVRQLNTNTIETVDIAGSVQTWVRMID